MRDFNSMTVVAAAEIIERMSTQAEFTTLVLGWGVDDFCGSGSVATKANNLARFALRMPQEVLTVHGKCKLSRAMVEHAITAPSNIIQHSTSIWSRLLAGLRFDGFEIVEEMVPDPKGGKSLFEDDPRMIKVLVLKRMLPEDIPGTDFREAESELEGLLSQHGFDVPKGHLTQAIAAFQRGEWSSANGELRNFYESYLNEIADGLGYDGVESSKAKRDFLGKLNPPFLLADYNEWDAQKTQFVQGLMNRMHPHGGHPGLSEEEDATFRLQISLITARLFLRRYSKRMAV